MEILDKAVIRRDLGADHMASPNPAREGELLGTAKIPRARHMWGRIRPFIGMSLAVILWN